MCNYVLCCACSCPAPLVYVYIYQNNNILLASYVCTLQYHATKSHTFPAVHSD